MNEYLNLWYILVETGTRRQITMMNGNGDKPNNVRNSMERGSGVVG